MMDRNPMLVAFVGLAIALSVLDAQAGSRAPRGLEVLTGTETPAGNGASRPKVPDTSAPGADTVQVAPVGDPGVVHIVDPTLVGPDELLGLVTVIATNGPEPGASCTGMLISSTTVLTAAHCFCTVDLVGDNDCGSKALVTFRADPNVRSGPSASPGSVQIHPDYNPSWVESQIENDLAIITLENSISPAHAKPFVVDDRTLAEGSLVMTAGRGLTGSDCSGPAGVFNFAFATITDYEDSEDIMTFEANNWCKGDSGGAVLDTAGNRLFGVISMETGEGSGETEKAITTYGHFDWIKSHMCLSSSRNQCDGHGEICNCSASTNILWRHARGQVGTWLVEGGAFTAKSANRRMTTAWQIQGTGDFDADGHDDVLWRHTSGQTAIWFMRNGSVVGESYGPAAAGPAAQTQVGAVSDGEDWNSWQIQGVGDFDADGRSDILWRHAMGQLAIWFAGDPAGIAYPGGLDPVWQVLGTGDFDGDGNSDILWRDTGGQQVVWFMAGGIRSDEGFPFGDPGSEFQAIGDFDGNLRSDILWRSASGRLSISFDGGEFVSTDHPSYQNLPPPAPPTQRPGSPYGDVVEEVRDNSDGGIPISPTSVSGDLSWHVQGVGDFDHDGRDDILWRHNSGQVAVWSIDGARFLGETILGSRTTSWQIEGLLRE